MEISTSTQKIAPVSSIFVPQILVSVVKVISAIWQRKKETNSEPVEMDLFVDGEAFGDGSESCDSASKAPVSKITPSSDQNRLLDQFLKKQFPGKIASYSLVGDCYQGKIGESSFSAWVIRGKVTYITEVR